MNFQKQKIEKVLNNMMTSFDQGPESLISFYAEDASIQLPFSKSNNAVMNRRQYFNHS